MLGIKGGAMVQRPVIRRSVLWLETEQGTTEVPEADVCLFFCGLEAST